MVWCFVHNSRNPFLERDSHFEIHSGSLTWTFRKLAKGVFLSNIWSLIFMFIFEGVGPKEKNYSTPASHSHRAHLIIYILRCSTPWIQVWNAALDMLRWELPGLQICRWEIACNPRKKFCWRNSWWLCVCPFSLAISWLYMCIYQTYWYQDWNWLPLWMLDKKNWSAFWRVNMFLISILRSRPDVFTRWHSKGCQWKCESQYCQPSLLSRSWFQPFCDVFFSYLAYYV